MKDLDEAADRYAVGEVTNEDLPMIATLALARGVNSPALTELACLHRSDCRDAPGLFLEALDELGLLEAIDTAWDSRAATVLLRRAENHAADLLADAGTPAARSAKIAALLHRLAHTEDPLNSDLSELAAYFEVLTVDWDEGYLERAVLADQMRLNARRLLDHRY
ncbi:hypothetical protein AB0B25_17965 [Nocardia sp. NPDC049190]|uniref:hypothetical protein n=1 Tax=Nocardia sp. NPDC049190 TaxID=3155650 RepID=UPI0033CEBB02